MPSACLVCRARVSIRWLTCCLRPSLSVVSFVLQMPCVVGSLTGPGGLRSGCPCRTGVANLAPSAVTPDEIPGLHQAVHHLAAPPLRDAEPGDQVLTGDHRVVGD